MDMHAMLVCVLVWDCMQVEGPCQRLCQSLGGEVHRLALQMQVLEESDTHAIEAEAVRPVPLLPDQHWYCFLQAVVVIAIVLCCE